MKKACWNPKCGAATTSRWRTGWVLRSGRKADLCDSCGSAYEQMRFCETFHLDEDGWKTCNTCKKHVHCGCIASAHLFVLLDAGGIECIDCAKKSGDMPMRLRDTPLLLRRLLRELMDPQRALPLVFRARIVFFLALLAIYVFSPVDILPEGILGIVGLLDDALVILIVFFHLATLYRSALVYRHGGRS